MVYYQLYKNFDEIPDHQKSEYYKNLIIRDFPETDYAMILLDPNYNLVVQARLNAASNLYYDTYSAYMNNQFYLVINNYNEALEKYQESELISKFEFLKALAFGKMQNLDTLKYSLENIVYNFPDSEVKPLALDILDRLRPDEEGNLVLLEEPVSREEDGSLKPPVEEFTSIYTANPSAVHFFALIVDGAKTNINALKIRLSDFNSNYFKLSQLKINSLVFDNDLQLVTVGNFESIEKAMVYYRSAMSNTYITTPLETANASAFAISADNYPLFYRDKDLETYLRFFEINYLNK
jgi:hypothetical protein